MTVVALGALLGTASVQADTAGAPAAPELANPASNGSSSAERHIMLAEGYARAAAAQRREVQALRRKGASDYQQAANGVPNKTGGEFPWLAKIRKTSEESIRGAQAQADEAQRHAEYHRFRAQELQGR